MHVMPRIKSFAVFLTVLISLASFAFGAATERRVLLYTKNQVGTNQSGSRYYVHDNIASSVEAIKKLGSENDFMVDVSDDPTVFTSSNLKRYKALIFSNTNIEIFDKEEQKPAFLAYIRGI